MIVLGPVDGEPTEIVRLHVEAEQSIVIKVTIQAIIMDYVGPKLAQLHVTLKVAAIVRMAADGEAGVHAPQHVGEEYNTNIKNVILVIIMDGAGPNLSQRHVLHIHVVQ